jgi:hypothetical protein
LLLYFIKKYKERNKKATLYKHEGLQNCTPKAASQPRKKKKLSVHAEKIMKN